MARKSKFIRNDKFDTVSPQVEDEILAVYSEITDGHDLLVRDLPKFFNILDIPKWFIADFLQCIDYFYSTMLPTRSIKVCRRQDYMTLNMVNYFTISSSQVSTIDDIIDIVDIDKLIEQTNKLIQFRNNYSFIISNWKLFINHLNVDAVESYKLTLPDLKKIKTKLNLEHGNLSDSLLIDMLSCSFTDSKGYILNFNHDISGPCVTLKSFAYILGELGELE
jgi:hypothetical protein